MSWHRGCSGIVAGPPFGVAAAFRDHPAGGVVVAARSVIYAWRERRGDWQQSVRAAGYKGFGCAARASRNALMLFLSTMAVPVSTNVGIGATGAARQSLNSCTAL